MKKNIHIIAIVAILVVAGAAFFGGIQYQKSQRGNFGQANEQNRTGALANRVNFRPVAGEILNTDDKSITVKLTDGSSKIVLFSDTTEIDEATQAAKTALTIGKKVAVMGTENSDGSVTATTIQLNPQMRQFGPSGAPRQ